jgi:hypothetical protein
MVWLRTEQPTSGKIGCNEAGVMEVSMKHELRHSDDTHSHPGSGTRRAFLSSLISTAVFGRWVGAGQSSRQGAAGQDSTADMAEQFRQMSEDYEGKGRLAQGQTLPALVRPNRSSKIVSLYSQ